MSSKHCVECVCMYDCGNAGWTSGGSLNWHRKGERSQWLS
jgi:hypothetical protein